MMKKYIKIDSALVEVSNEVYDEYYRMNRKEKYQVERDIAKGTLYYEGFATDEITGEEMITDNNQKSVEEEVELVCMIPILYDALQGLDEKEKVIIRLIYFENKSVRYLSGFLKIPETTIRRKHNAVLHKLRQFME